jgi:hypothetical protein
VDGWLDGPIGRMILFEEDEERSGNSTTKGVAPVRSPRKSPCCGAQPAGIMRNSG